MPEETLSPAEAPAEDMEHKQLQETYNDLSNLERQLERLMPEHGMNQEAPNLDARKEFLKGNEQDSLAFNLKQIHSVLSSASRAESNEECEKVWGPITVERLGKDLFMASKGFRLVHKTGILNASSIDTKDYGFDWKTAREPIPLNLKDAQDLKEAPLRDRIEVISELLDTFRFRADKHAPESHKKALSEEQPIILELIKTLPESEDRDFLAIEAARHFAHVKINQPKLASEVIGLISVPEFREVVSKSVLKSLEHSPEKIVQEISKDSSKNLDKLLESKQVPSQVAESLKIQAEELSNEFAITMTVSKKTLKSILFDSNRILSLVDTHGSSGSGSVAGPRERMRVEDKLGIHAPDDMIADRPVYAALALSDDEKAIGTADTQNYGGFVIQLKDSVAQERTCFTFGDSQNAFYSEEVSRQDAQSSRLSYKEAKVAKLLHDRLYPGDRPDAVERYVEAQVLEGVTVDDIESITIPFFDAQNDFKVRTITERFPDIKVRVSLSQDEFDKISDKNKEFIKQELGVELVILSDKATTFKRPKKHGS